MVLTIFESVCAWDSASSSGEVDGRCRLTCHGSMCSLTKDKKGSFPRNSDAIIPCTTMFRMLSRLGFSGGDSRAWMNSLVKHRAQGAKARIHTRSPVERATRRLIDPTGPKQTLRSIRGTGFKLSSEREGGPHIPPERPGNAIEAARTIFTARPAVGNVGLQSPRQNAALRLHTVSNSRFFESARISLYYRRHSILHPAGLVTRTVTESRHALWNKAKMSSEVAAQEKRPLIVGPDEGPEEPFPLWMEGKVTTGFKRGSTLVSQPPFPFSLPLQPPRLPLSAHPRAPDVLPH